MKPTICQFQLLAKLAIATLLYLCMVIALPAQNKSLEFKVQYLETEQLTWGVYVRPASGFPEGANGTVTASGQVTLLTENQGEDAISNIQSVHGEWNGNYESEHGPVEAPQLSYFFIGLNNQGAGIPLTNEKETLLFTFQMAACPNRLELIDNTNDPLHTPLITGEGNSIGNNPGIDLAVFNTDDGQIHNWKNNYALDAFRCVERTISPQENGFDLKLQYMSSDDNTWGIYARLNNNFEEAKELQIGTGQVTLLMRKGDGIKIQNLQRGTGSWRQIAYINGPAEAPAIDYVSFAYGNGEKLQLEPMEEVLLFTFQTDECLDTLGIIENTDPFAQLPNSERTNPANDISAVITSPGNGIIDKITDIYNTAAYSCHDCDQDGIADALEDTNGDGRYTPGVDASNLCDNKEADELAAPPAAQNSCITVNNITQTAPTGCGTTDGILHIDAVHETGNIIQYSIDGGRIWRNTPTISNLEAGVPYQLELRDILGLCFESYGVVILDNPNCIQDPCVATPFNITNEPDQIVCAGESAILTASSGTSYAWSPSTGLSASDIANPTAMPTETITYTVTVTRADGCTATDDITITVATPPTGSAGANQTICAGTSVTLNASGGVSYNWSPDNSLSNLNIATPVATPSTTTTYTVSIADANQCTTLETITITIADDLSISLGDDMVICSEDEPTLTASGGVGYVWSPIEGLDDATSPTPTVSISTTTTYCVTVTNAEGCLGTDCITVQVDEECEGEDIGDAGNSGQTFNPCIIGPAIVACPDKFMCTGTQTQLIVNGGILWEWSPAEGLDDPTSATPIAAPSETTTYYVTGADALGCTAIDSVTVNVLTTGDCDQKCTDDNLLEETEIFIDTLTNIAQVCIPYPQEELDITFSVSLLIGTPSIIHGCDFSEVYNYQYNFLPQAGLGTNYRIKSWEVANIIQTGTVNSMQELLTFMQAADPNGNWYLDDTRFSIIGGNIATSYGDLTITHNTQETVLRKNITQLPTGTLVEVDMTDKDRELLTLTDLVTGCTDQLLILRIIE